MRLLSLRSLPAEVGSRLPVSNCSLAVVCEDGEWAHITVVENGYKLTVPVSAIPQQQGGNASVSDTKEKHTSHRSAIISEALSEARGATIIAKAVGVSTPTARKHLERAVDDGILGLQHGPRGAVYGPPDIHCGVSDPHENLLAQGVKNGKRARYKVSLLKASADNRKILVSTISGKKMLARWDQTKGGWITKGGMVIRSTK